MRSRCRDNEARHPHPYADSATPRPRSLSRYYSSTFNMVLLEVVVVVVVGLVSPVRGGLMDFSAPDVLQYGACAQPKDQEPLDFSQFSGLWYQVKMVPNSYMEAKKCITLMFTWNGGEYNVSTKGLNEYNEQTRQDAIIMRVLPPDPAIPGPYLQIMAPAVPPVPYHVVKTDYHRFACVYSCYELFSLMFETFSVLSRRPEMDEASLAACHRVFSRLDLDTARLKSVKQDGPCVWLQEEGSGEEPERQNVDDEDDENALATLTSEEVNQRRAPIAASAQRSESAVDEDTGETMMEMQAMQELQEVVEVQGRGVIELEETVPFTDSRLELSTDHTEGYPEKELNRARQRKINWGHQGGKTGRAKENNSSMASPDLQHHLDDPHLQSLYDNEETRRAAAAPGEGRGEASAATPWTHDRLGGGAGGIPAPGYLLLIALLSLALCACVPPKL